MATLLDCVDLFIQHTGRNDLVVNSIEDALTNATEIIENPGFEGTYVAGLAPEWNKLGSTLTCTEETSDISSQIPGNTKAQKLVNTNSLSNGIYTNAISLERGKTYRLSFWYKVTAGSIRTIQFDDTTYGPLSKPSQFLYNSGGLTGSSWTNYTIDFKSAIDGSSHSLIFKLALNSTVYLDAVSLKMVEGGPDARWYINQAIDFLDQQQETPQSDAWYVSTPTAGNYTLAMQNVRFIKEVWAKQADGDRVLLERIPLQAIRQYYSQHPDEIDQGCPLYWTLGSPRQAPEQQGDTVNTVEGEHLLPAPESYTQIQFYPPTDGTYTIMLLGSFYSRPLDFDNYSNWWTVNKPWLVVWTAKYILEGALRSDDGMKSLMAFIQPYLTSIDKDLVELEISGYNMVLEG